VALAVSSTGPYDAPVGTPSVRARNPGPSSSEADAAPVLRLLGGRERGILGFLLLANLTLTVAAAVSSDSVFQVDEYFQVVEFASHKLGWTAAADLPWEHAARIRPWMQPAFYVALARGAGAAGVRGPFALLRIYRLASGLLAWSALVALILSVRSWFQEPVQRRAMYLSLTLLYFLPYLAARTSSESLSTSFLLLGLALVGFGGAPDAGPVAGASWRDLAAGAALGLAVECRFQVALSVLGVLLWTLVYGRERARRLAGLGLGIALAAGAGLLVDRWGYGTFVLVPWNYFRVNVLEGKASTFGVLPFFSYPFILLLTFPPFGAMIAAGMAALWWRCPRHLLTWFTLPFFVGHSFIAHKEFRFLFPLLVPGTLCLLVLWARPQSLPGRLGTFLRALEAAWFSRATWAFNALALAILCFLPSSDNFGLQRFFYEHAQDPVRWVGLTDPASPHRIRAPFLAPKPAPPVALVSTVDELSQEVSRSPLPVMVTAKFPLPDGAEAFLQAHGKRVFSSLPPALARANLFGWVERADLTYVYLVTPEPPPGRPP